MISLYILALFHKIHDPTPAFIASVTALPVQRPGLHGVLLHAQPVFIQHTQMAARLGVSARAARPVKFSGPVVAFLNPLPRLVFESQMRATGHMAASTALAKRSHCVGVSHVDGILMVGQQPDTDTPQAVMAGTGFAEPFQRDARIGFDTIAVLVHLAQLETGPGVTVQAAGFYRSQLLPLRPRDGGRHQQQRTHKNCFYHAMYGVKASVTPARAIWTSTFSVQQRITAFVAGHY